jgi:hypothetical protein
MVSRLNRATLGGDFASAAVATAYYPPSDRGAGRVFGTALINTVNAPSRTWSKSLSCGDSRPKLRMKSEC